MLVLLLRLLLPRHADGQRVQRAGDDRAAAFPAPAGSGQVRLLRPLRGRCPMDALAVDAKEKTWRHRQERCIGCGLCALACETKHAIAMEPVPDYKLPYKSWFALLSRSVPQMLTTAWKVRRERR